MCMCKHLNKWCHVRYAIGQPTFSFNFIFWLSFYVNQWRVTSLLMAAYYSKINIWAIIYLTISLLMDTNLEPSYFLCQYYKHCSFTNDHSRIIIMKYLSFDVKLIISVGPFLRSGNTRRERIQCFSFCCLLPNSP